MWRLWKIIFGYEYVIAECGYNRNVHNIRVHKLGNKFYYKCDGKIILIEAPRFGNDNKVFPLSMNQEDFNKMLEINKDT